MTTQQSFSAVDEYIGRFPVEVQSKLEQLRSTIKKIAPGAEEVISYKMPAFRLNGMLVWYAGYDRHIGFYPTPSPIRVFQKELAGYKTSKGAIQFPLGKSLPLNLVKKIVKFRIIENEEKMKSRQNKKPLRKPGKS